MRNPPRFALVPFLLTLALPLAASLVLAACDQQEDTGEDLDVMDAEPDVPADVGTTDAEEDTTVDSADDAAEEIAPDTVPDADADPPDVVRCEEGRRPVGDLCRKPFDRACFSDDNCRENERCTWGEGEDTARPGTCIYEFPAPVVCPGSPECEDGTGPLRVGFAAHAITPRGWELARPGYSEGANFWGQLRHFVGDVEDPSTFCDCGRDMVCPPGEEYDECYSVGEWTGPDADGTEGDGRMQGAWIAGFSNSKNATLCPEEWLGDACDGPHCCVHPLAHDEIWARTVILEQGDTRLAWVVVDTVGFFYSDAKRVAESLDPALGIDWLLVSATHTHNAPDTIGQWGPGFLGDDLPTNTGAYPEWMDDVRAGVAASVTEAASAMAEADVYAGHADTGPIGFAVRDTRNPFIFDDRLSLLAFVRAGGTLGDPEDTLGTIANWHSHPEAVADGNAIITSDFPHWVRHHIEQGFAEAGVEGFPARQGMGGIALYASGSVGGLLNPLHRPAIGRDGVAHSANRWEKAEALGQRLADLALVSFGTECESPGDQACMTRLESPPLRFVSRELVLDVSNVNFHIALMDLELFDRPVYNWRVSDGVLPGDNLPKALTAITQIRLGDVVMQTFPGELFPELVTGFHPEDVVRAPILGDWMDMNCAPDRRTRLPEEAEAERFGCMIDARNENPPDLDAAPRGAPLGARLGGEYLFVIGLGNDQLGYLVPPYDFQTELRGLAQSPGDHYEETVSLGNVVDTLIDEVDGLTDLLVE